MALDEGKLSDGFIAWFDRGTANEFENDVLKSATALAEYIDTYAQDVEITLNVIGANPALASTTGPTDPDPNWPPTLAPVVTPTPSVVNALIATLAVAFDQGETGWEYFATGQSSTAEIYSNYFSLSAPPDEMFMKYLVELEKENLDTTTLSGGGVRDFSTEDEQPEIAEVAFEQSAEPLAPGYGAYLAGYSSWSAPGSYVGEATPELEAGTSTVPGVGMTLYQDLDYLQNNETDKQSSADAHAAAIHAATTGTTIPEGTFTNPMPYISVSVEIFLE